MKIDIAAARKCLKSFDFNTLFREQLGWDKHNAHLDIPIDGTTYRLNAVAEKRGFTAYVCPSIPDRATRLKIDHQVTKASREHFVVYSDQAAGQQVWHWVRREPGKPLASRDHRFDTSQSGESLVQRLERIAVSFAEEESTTIVDVSGGVRAAFDVDKVTKKFYERFKAEHAAFLKFIKGIKTQADLEWYTSLMLNRLMFVYFIQKKGFLDGDADYLRNRMRLVREAKGKDKFHSFYRYFLLRLFHDGLGKSPEERKLDRELEKLLGKVPYLNGGFFEVHQLEERNAEIDIPDKAFEKLFDFFDNFSWHLDERPLRADNEINPDVVGYIFEKYVNQKQMGAYYTKEDITEYISKNAIIPFLFDAAEKKCPIAFKEGSFLWRLLADDPDRYIYSAVRHGVIDQQGNVIPLPKDTEPGVKDLSKRGGWNKTAADPYALPSETWREHVARRQRCLELREKLKTGKVHAINDLISLNLDIWQFARDAIVNSEGPELLRAFWQAIEKVTVLDPTCGSGAFLFAALRILETLYSDCLERMERFVDDLSGKPHHPEQFNDFKKVLAQIAKHPNDRYFILKSIIIGNLFGVDIMEEAVEICKLRLFLKLVAQVETVNQIEPLPDIDFNIRAGNTLVGYVSLEQVRKASESEQKGTSKQKLMLDSDAQGEIRHIEEDAEQVEKCFSMFRAQQTTHGGKVTSNDKQELRRRLEKLDAQLDRYLAGECGIAAAQSEAFRKWRHSHQPFHWFVEFYGIMDGGGFDVIIGNPPYKELRAVTEYQIRNLSTVETKNLYPPVMERCLQFSSSTGRLGFIVPVSSISTEGYRRLQDVLFQFTGHFSSYDDRPSRLFDGLEHIQLTIHLIQHSSTPHPEQSVTECYRWSAVERPFLFAKLQYEEVEREFLPGCLAKLSKPLEHSILKKIWSDKPTLGEQQTKLGKHVAYYSRKVHNFLQALDFVPEVYDGKGKLRPPTELKELTFTSQAQAALSFCLLNSSLFRWFINVFSDCRHVNKREVEGFRIDLSRALKDKDTVWLALAKKLSKRLKETAEFRNMRFAHDHLRVQCIIPKHSKDIIDEIDRELARHFRFSSEEIDFIVNYDIKYRVGGSDDDSDDE